MKKNFEVIIVTRSIMLQQGLDALLGSLPGISSVRMLRELSDTYDWIGAHQPRIILLDADVLGNTIKTALEKIKTLSPKTPRVLLVDEADKLNLVPKYAEAILIKGTSPSALTSIIVNLLSEQGDEDEQNDSN